MANARVIALAITIGVLLVKMPKTNHNNVPMAKSKYIDKEMPLVSLVRMVLIACGRKDVVVQKAAINPSTVIQFFSFIYAMV